MTGPVMWRLAPIADESLMSLVTRTAAKNLLPSASVLLRQVGCPHAQNPSVATNSGVDVGLLAEILRQPASEIELRRSVPLPYKGFVNSFGSAIRADEIVVTNRRFGPTALATSPHIRAIWSNKAVPCCTEHWEYLVDRCSCGAVQRWQAATHVDRCDDCNAKLSQVHARQVDTAIREALSFIIGLLDPVESRRRAARELLPPPLAKWDGGLVFQLALAIMPTTSTGYVPRRGHAPPEADLPDFAASLAQAAEIVRGWPNTFVKALTDRVKERAVSKRNVRYKGPAHYLSSLASTLLPPMIVETFEEALAPVRAMPGSSPASQIGMREASKLLGHEEYALATARRANQLRTRLCFRAGRLLPMLDRDEVEMILDFVNNRIGPERASDQLNLPQYALTQLSREGLLSFYEHPYIVGRFGNRQMHGAELARFRQRLRDAACSTAAIEDPVSLRQVARAIGGGPKPWGKILKTLLEDGVPFALRGEAEQIFISTQHAALIQTFDAAWGQTAEWPEHISQRDAAEILNLNLKRTGILPGEPSPGGAHRIPCADIRKLARDRITLAELSARTGLQSTRLEHRLAKDGCARHDFFGWPRKAALALIATY
jgi:hypothetical protein